MGETLKNETQTIKLNHATLNAAAKLLKDTADKGGTINVALCQAYVSALKKDIEETPYKSVLDNEDQMVQASYQMLKAIFDKTSEDSTTVNQFITENQKAFMTAFTYAV